jgi:hypothetical protein
MPQPAATGKPQPREASHPIGAASFGHYLPQSGMAVRFENIATLDGFLATLFRIERKLRIGVRLQQAGAKPAS